MATNYIDLNKLKRFMGYLYKRFLPLSGGVLTGALILNADPTNVLGAATKQYVDNRNYAVYDISGSGASATYAIPKTNLSLVVSRSGTDNPTISIISTTAQTISIKRTSFTSANSVEKYANDALALTANTPVQIDSGVLLNSTDESNTLIADGSGTVVKVTSWVSNSGAKYRVCCNVIHN